jgi:hypothetical protein
LGSLFEKGWTTVAIGKYMKKLNTHLIYQLAQNVHPIATLADPEGTEQLGKILWPMVRCAFALRKHTGEDGVFSSSLKRAADSLLNGFHGVGLPVNLSDVFDVDETKVVQPWEILSLRQKANEFETVLANELPGLAIYYVPHRGIYSTDDLIYHSDAHIPLGQRAAVPAKGKSDVIQAGRCLAFELPTASAFHMWRAVETMMDKYHWALTDKTFAEAGIIRNWGQYIPALEKAGADVNITKFLDHIRSAYRNPISHPEVNLEYEDAFNLFSAALSAMGQMAKAIIAAKPAPESPDGSNAVVASSPQPESV